MRRLAFMLAVAGLAGALAPAATADGGGRATDLAAGFGAMWTTSGAGLVRLDPASGKIAGRPFPTAPVTRLAAGGGALWGLRGRILVRAEPRTGTLRRIRLAQPSYSLAAGFGSVWVPRYRDGRLVRLDARTGRVTRLLGGVGRAAEDVTTGFGSVWVVGVGPWHKGPGGTMVPLGRGTLTRVDPATNRILARVSVGRGAGALALGAGAVWVASFRGVGADNTISRIDPQTNRVTTTIRLPRRPVAVAAGGDYAWALVGSHGLVRISPVTSRTREVSIPHSWSPSSVEVFAGAVWVASEGSATVSRFDPRTLKSTTVEIPMQPRLLAPPRAERTTAGAGGPSIPWVPAAAVVAALACVLAFGLRAAR